MLSKRKIITAPFSATQIDRLNHYQVGVNIFCGHPYTCPLRSESLHGAEGWDKGLLIATDTGWVCPHCGYTQDWADENMVAPSIVPSEETWRDFGVSVQHVNLLLLERTDKAIAQYLALYQSHRPVNADGDDAKDEKLARVLQVVPFMLSSLRRKRLQLMGVTVGLGAHPAVTAVDESWIDLEKHTPQLGVEVQVLWRDPVTTVADGPTGGITSNPLHEGYGCNAWIDTRKIAGGSFLTGGGFATHWREVPAPSLTKPPAIEEQKPIPGGWVSIKDRAPQRNETCDWLYPTTDFKRERWVLCGESMVTASVPGRATHWRPAQSLPN